MLEIGMIIFCCHWVLTRRTDGPNLFELQILMQIFDTTFSGVTEYWQAELMDQMSLNYKF